MGKGVRLGWYLAYFLSCGHSPGGSTLLRNKKCWGKGKGQLLGLKSRDRYCHDSSHHTLLPSGVWAHLPLKSLRILEAPFQVVGTIKWKVLWPGLNGEFATTEEGDLPSSFCSSTFWFFPCANSCHPCWTDSALKAGRQHLTFHCLWLFWSPAEQNQSTKGQVSIKTCADKQRDHRGPLPFFGVTRNYSICLTLLHLKEQSIRQHWQIWEGWGNRLEGGVVGVVSEGGRLQREELSHLKLLPRGCILCASSWEGCDHSCLLPHSINIVWLHYKIMKL